MTAPADTRWRPRLPILWWAGRRSYLVFVLRELSAVFVAWFVVFLLLVIRAVYAGEAEYRRFLDIAASPWMLALNVVALAFVLLHAVTWFALAPKAIVVHLRGRRVPAPVVAVSQYAGWLVVSAFVVWLLVGAG